MLPTSELGRIHCPVSPPTQAAAIVVNNVKNMDKRKKRSKIIREG